MNGRVDFIYGAGHAAGANGSGATVGVENLTGTVGIQSVFNMAGGVMPSTSRTYTPQ
jgi:hypothetical protein